MGTHTQTGSSRGRRGRIAALSMAALVALTLGHSGGHTVPGLPFTPSVALGQESGDRVFFAIQSDILITGSDEDKVVIIGKPNETTLLTGCTGDTNEWPIQSAVLVHPEGGRATRLSGLTFLGWIDADTGDVFDQTGPLRNGMRLGNLEEQLQCTHNGLFYSVFKSIVE